MKSSVIMILCTFFVASAGSDAQADRLAYDTPADLCPSAGDDDEPAFRERGGAVGSWPNSPSAVQPPGARQPDLVEVPHHTPNFWFMRTADLPDRAIQTLARILREPRAGRTSNN